MLKIQIQANSWPPALNFKSFYRSIEQFFLPVGHKNLGNKIPITHFAQKNLTMKRQQLGTIWVNKTLLKLEYYLLFSVKNCHS